jgi:hypothetical protein
MDEWMFTVLELLGVRGIELGIAVRFERCALLLRLR